MFSGKTEELIRRLKRARIAHMKVEIFKPSIDTRYHELNIVSHDETAIQSTPVDNSQTILLLAHEVDVIGPVRVVGADGYRLETRDVTVDLKQRTMTSRGAASGAMRLGEFQAGQMSADLGARTVVLDGGVRLKITQGAVR